MPIEEHRFQVSANPNDRGVWAFELNPATHELRPERDQNLMELVDGSLFVLEPQHDSTILTLSWQNVPSETFEDFIFGRHENLAFRKAYFYRQGQGTLSTITDMSFEAKTHDTVNMPFETDGQVFLTVTFDQDDRFFVGAKDPFYGILFDFEDYHSFQVDANDNNLVESIRLRFPDATGDLAAGDTVTYDSLTNIEDDDTDLFQHYGTLTFSASQTDNWRQASLTNILTNTSSDPAGFDIPSGFVDNELLYWCEIKVTPDTTYATSLNAKIQGLKTGIDSIESLSARKSNGILPIWWLNIPDVLKVHRPRGFREAEWLGIKVTNFTAQLTNPSQERWNMTLSFVPIDGREAAKTFQLDVSHLDGENFLG